MSEIWKPVITLGLQNFYEVSNLGNVRSLPRKGETPYGIRNYGGNIVKPIKTKTGYLAVNLTYKGFRTQCNIHTLVLEAFICKKPENMEACHNDGDRTNPKLDNLRWDTRKNNHSDKKLHGTWQGGEKANNVKLTENEAKIIKFSTLSAKQLSEKFNISKTQVLRIKNNKSWAHIK